MIQKLKTKVRQGLFSLALAGSVYLLGGLESRVYSYEEPLMTELKEFVNCLENNEKPKTDLGDSVLVIKVIDAMQKSINNDGKTILLQ